MLRRLLNNDYLFSVLNKVVSIFIGIFSSVLINRYLGPELKGEYAYICNTVNIVVIVANLGFYQSYPNMKRKGMENQQQKYLNIFVAQFLIYVAVCTILALLFKTPVMVAILILVPVQVFANQLSMIALVDFLKLRQMMQIVASVLNLLLYFVVYIIFDADIYIAIVLLFVKDLIFIVAYMMKLRCIPNPFNIELGFTRYLFSFGVFAMLSALLNKMNYKVDVIMMKSYIPYTEIGLYSVGAGLAEYAWLISDAFKDVLFARTAKSDSVQSVVLAIKINAMIIAFILLGVLAFGKFAIAILYGMEYINSYKVTCVIFMGIPAMVLFKLIAPLYIANGKQKMYFVVMLVSVISNLGINFICIPIYGKIGAAFASVVSYSICGIVFYLKFIQDYGIKWYEPLLLRKSDIKSLINRLGRKKSDAH